MISLSTFSMWPVCEYVIRLAVVLAVSLVITVLTIKLNNDEKKNRNTRSNGL